MGETPKTMSSKRNIIILVVVMAVVIVGGIIAAVAVGTSGKTDIAETLTLAERYLDEASYEQAIIEFDKILETDPMNIDAYIGKAKALIGLGDKDKAIDVLRKAYELIGNDAIYAMLGKITDADPHSPETTKDSSVSITENETVNDPSDAHTSDDPHETQDTADSAETNESTAVTATTTTTAATTTAETTSSATAATDIADDPEVIESSDISVIESEENAETAEAIENSEAPINSSGTTADGFVYTIRNSLTTIEDYVGTASDVVIPAAIEGCPVTIIGKKAFMSCSDISAVSIPDSVISIEKEAFRACGSLISVTLPDSITVIKDSAFFGCNSLTSITIPDGVTEIERWAFQSCDALTSVTLPDSLTTLGTWAFHGCSKDLLIYYKGGTYTNSELTDLFGVA